MGIVSPFSLSRVNTFVFEIVCRTLFMTLPMAQPHNYHAALSQSPFFFSHCRSREVVLAIIHALSCSLLTVGLNSNSFWLVAFPIHVTSPFGNSSARLAMPRRQKLVTCTLDSLFSNGYLIPSNWRGSTMSAGRSSPRWNGSVV